jgi:hypothetical protein
MRPLAALRCGPRRSATGGCMCGVWSSPPSDLAVRSRRHRQGLRRGPPGGVGRGTSWLGKHRHRPQDHRRHHRQRRYAQRSAASATGPVVLGISVTRAVPGRDVGGRADDADGLRTPCRRSPVRPVDGPHPHQAIAEAQRADKTMLAPRSDAPNEAGFGARRGRLTIRMLIGRSASIWRVYRRDGEAPVGRHQH